MKVAGFCVEARADCRSKGEDELGEKRKKKGAEKKREKEKRKKREGAGRE